MYAIVAKRRSLLSLKQGQNPDKALKARKDRVLSPGNKSLIWIKLFCPGVPVSCGHYERYEHLLRCSSQANRRWSTALLCSRPQRRICSIGCRQQVSPVPSGGGRTFAR